MSQERERDIRAFLDSFPGGFLTLDQEEYCIYVNPAGERLLGVGPEEVLGRQAAVIFPQRFAHARQAGPESEAVGLEFEEYVATTGRWLEVRGAPAPGGSLSLYFHDVTERKRTEEEGRRSRRELLDFFEKATEGLHWVGPDGTILWANQAELEMLGYTPEEYIGRSIVEFHADGEVIQEILQRLKSGEELCNHEARMRRKDGSIRHVLINSNVLRYDGEFVHTRCFTRDVTARREAEDALRAHVEALRAADRRKDEFLAMLAHELRNPLAPILTAVEIFRFRDLQDPVLQKQREVIERQVKQMRRLLDDLLDVSRITRGKIQVDSERLDLATVLTQAVETSRPLIEGRDHALAVVLPDEPLLVEADPVRLSQVFTNLLNNAARYTEPGGKIWLTAQREGERVRVGVRDTGIGMPAEMIDEVFDLFVQGDRALDRSPGGLGIGLTLVRELVGRHGGTVRAHSAGPGEGSEFEVILPLAAGPAPASAAPTAAAPERARNRCGSVLLVDDNLDQAEGVSLVLEREGYTVCVAPDGRAALEQARAHRPTIAILDIGLPGMDGYELARRLREEPGLPHMALIAMTGYGRREDRAASRASGFDYHLVKPLEMRDLLAVLSGFENGPKSHPGGGRSNEEGALS